MSSLVKPITSVTLLLSLIFFFFFRMHDVSDVLCPRNARVALACGSWRATTTRALRNRLLGSKDPPARSILLAQHCIYIYIHHDTSLSTARILNFLRAERSRTVFVCRERVARQTNVFHRSGSLLLSFFEFSLPFLITDRERGKNDRVTLFTGCGLLDRRPEKAIDIMRFRTRANELFRDLYC